MTERQPAPDLFVAGGSASRADGRPNMGVNQARGRAIKVYRRFDHYYKNKADMYTRIGLGLQQKLGQDAQVKSAIKTIRNPVHRVCEFYATTMLVGTARQAFPITDETEGVRDAIHTFWRWSNLDVRKQVIKRLVVRYGRVFTKVRGASKTDPRVWMQLIKPEYVTDFQKDDRGNIVYIRIDVDYEDPDLLADNPQEAKRTYTEIWRKGVGGKEGYCRAWIRPQDVSDDTVLHERAFSDAKNTGVVKQTANLRLVEGNVSGDSVGHNFVPIADTIAMDDGEKWPEPIYDHSLSLVDEIQKMATRMHDLLFLYNKPHRALTGIGNDPKTGRPYGPPEVRDRRQASSASTEVFAGEVATLLDAGDKQDVSLNGDIMIGLPGNVQVADITPNLNYKEMREEILSCADELEQQLPELLYFKTLDKAELSGRSLRLIMSGAIDRTFEMRSNIENTLVAIDNMALTLGQLANLPGFQAAKIGEYDPLNGYKHSFEEREILQPSDLENEELRGRRIANAIAMMQLGIPAERAFAEVGLGHLPIPADLQQQIAGLGVPATGGDAQTGAGTAGTTSPATQGSGQLGQQELETIGQRLAGSMGGFGSSRNT